MRDTFERFQPRDRGRFGDSEQADEVERLPAKGGRKLHDLDCVVLDRRERAVKVRLASNGRSEWFPLSQVEVSSKEGGKDHVITVPEWILTQKGIV
jgi:hypothetical protein